jgi:DNA-binding GntR family transcriptional regulator
MSGVPGDDYERLRHAIVRGELAPNTRLVEADIGTTFQMARSAVRNALIRLEQEGLVVRERHRGARVRHVGDEEAIEILQARAVLEGLAARQAAERIDADGVARLQACLARHRELLADGDLLGASDANATLHATLLEISGHRTAVRLIEALNAQTVRYQYRTILIAGRPAASHAEHAQIVEAVIAGRADDAENAMRTHLFNVAEALQGGRLPGGIDNASRGVLQPVAAGSREGGRS